MLTLDDVTSYIKTDPHKGGLQVALATDQNNKDLSDKIEQIHSWIESNKEILGVRFFFKHKELGYIERSGIIDLSNQLALSGAIDGDSFALPGLDPGAANWELPGLDPELGERYVCPTCGAKLFVLKDDKDSIEIPPLCKNTSNHSNPVRMDYKPK